MKRISVLLTTLLLLPIVAACQPQEPATSTDEPTTQPTAAITPATTESPPAGGELTASAELGDIAPVSLQLPANFTPSSSTTFANFTLPPVEQAAQVQAPDIAPDLSNVELTVLLTPEQRDRIAQNGFVVSPGDSYEFYQLYEQARYENLPVFVTSDSLLHTYHLLFDTTLRRTETAFFIPMLTSLNFVLMQTSVEQYGALAGTPWEDAARRNAAYFALAVKLLNPDWPVPEGLRDLVDPDLANIMAHNTIGPSAIFPGYEEGEDWSQYVPRGHYTKSEALERYFMAMMWHGRMTFRANDPVETQQAALLTLALRQTTVGEQPAEAIWSGIYEPTSFFVGRSDDLTPQEYSTALDEAYGQINAVSDLVDDAKFTSFQQAVAELRPPQILGMVVSPDEPDVEEATKGLRFMGQRFVLDAFVFDQLIDGNVPGRGLPKALDFFAALGSARALTHLEDMGDTAMPNYQQKMDELRTTFAGYGEDVWTQNLYWTWIHSLRPLLEPVDVGYPQFMQSDAWLDKQLNTSLGSWTELKRDTILYAKQVYAEGGGGGPPVPELPKGYVEPVPLAYARIAALSQMTIDGLESRGLLAEQDKAALQQMVDTATRLQIMAEKQLRNEPLTEEEYEFLRGYGRTLESLTFATADQDGEGSGDQAAVVADVATNAGSGEVLEQGVGRIFEIYVAVPIEGRLVLTTGGVFSHYEFVQPLSERLTDEAWRAMLDAGETPPLADWTNSFMVMETAEQPLAETIIAFNDGLAEAFWYADVKYVERFLGPVELEDTRAYIDELRAQNQFVGAKRLSLEFLSFDIQDENRATVTTRERWEDTLYAGSAYDAERAVVGVRSAYEMGVTYTMERQDDQWKLTQIVLQPEQPAWEDVANTGQ